MNASRFRNTIVGIALVGAIFLAGGLARAGTIFESFSTDPSTRGWVGFGGATAPNSYGWSSATNHAGGAVGEAGGTFQARVGTGNFWGYWDSTLGGTLSQTQPLTATGIFSVPSLSSFNGGVDFGYLNVTNPASVGTSGNHSGGNSQMIGFRFNDGSDTTYRVNPQMAFGTAVALRATSSNFFTLDVGTDYKFTVTYDPNGGGIGMGVTTLAVNLLSDNSPVGSPISTGVISSTGAAIALDAFGFNGLRFASNTTTANIFVDDLAYSAVIPEPNGISLAAAALAIGGSAGFRRHRRTYRV